MNSLYFSIFNWISSQQKTMEALLIEWAAINSGTENISGIRQMIQALKVAFALLGIPPQTMILPPTHRFLSNGEKMSFPLGEALLWQKKLSGLPTDFPSVLLGGHLDTVYSAQHPFQRYQLLNLTTLQGPGVTDMKGGLIILLYALLAFERSPFASLLNWEILINPDEEIGSPGSAFLWQACAKRNQLALLFEPSFADGKFVSSRKGSANFALLAKGRAAHAGRDFFEGRNAITALSRLLLEIEQLTNETEGITVNIGSIQGGSAVNSVPDLAVAHFNVRVMQLEDQKRIKKNLEDLVNIKSQEGLTFILHEESATPPKPFDSPQQNLFEALQFCAKQLTIPFDYRSSGGTCDGSRLYQYGLPNIDTLGAVGGHIHSPTEYIYLPSLTERATLTALFLMELAQGHLEIGIR